MTYENPITSMVRSPKPRSGRKAAEEMTCRNQQEGRRSKRSLSEEVIVDEIELGVQKQLYINNALILLLDIGGHLSNDIGENIYVHTSVSEFEQCDGCSGDDVESGDGKAESEPERVVLDLHPWVVATTHGSENRHGIVACPTDTNIVDEWEVW